MLELLKYVTSDFWVWLGTVILLTILTYDLKKIAIKFWNEVLKFKKIYKGIQNGKRDQGQG